MVPGSRSSEDVGQLAACQAAPLQTDRAGRGAPERGLIASVGGAVTCTGPLARVTAALSAILNGELLTEEFS